MVKLYGIFVVWFLTYGISSSYVLRHSANSLGRTVSLEASISPGHRNSEHGDHAFQDTDFRALMRMQLHQDPDVTSVNKNEEDRNEYFKGGASSKHSRTVRDTDQQRIWMWKRARSVCLLKTLFIHPSDESKEIIICSSVPKVDGTRVEGTKNY